MKIPQDFAGDGDLKVYCLCKSLYILQQTSRGTKSSQVKTIFLPTRGCLNVVAFCNTDLLGCNFTRQSQNKLYYAPQRSSDILANKEAISGSRSSALVEYKSMTSNVSEVLWLHWLLLELSDPQYDPTPLYYDNQVA